MICKECAWEADTVKKKGSRGKQRIDYTNSKAWYPIGHAACKGETHCDCQHKDVGSRIPVVDE